MWRLFGTGYFGRKGIFDQINSEGTLRRDSRTEPGTGIMWSVDENRRRQHRHYDVNE